MENKQLKVLIVDDDKFLLDMYSVKLKKKNCEVNTSTGGDDAYQKLKDGYNPEIVVLDIVMPGMDGLELLKKIRGENLAKDSVVVVLSNQGQPEDIKRAEDLNVDGYIIKALAIPTEVVDKVMEIYKKKKG